MKKFLLTLLIITFFLAGCSGEGALIEVLDEPEQPLGNPELVSTAEPQPEAAGSLKLSMRLPKTLNPLKNEDASVDEILRLVYEPLVIYDEHFLPVQNPALIDYINIALDGMSVIVNLKNGLQWEDGSPICSKDIDFSFKTLIAAPDTAVYKHCVANVESVEILTESSVKITYASQFQGLLYSLMFPVIPEKTADINLLSHIYKESLPIGNGIYRFSEYAPSQKLVLTSSGSALREPAYISEVEVVITKDYETDLNAYSQRLIDVARCNLSDWGTMLGVANSKSYELPSTYFDFIGFNFSNPLFSQPEVRKTIAMSFSIDEAISAIYLNRAEKAPALIHPQSFLFDTAANSAEFSLDKANTLLYENGFADTDGDKVYEKYLSEEGLLVPLKFTILYNNDNVIRERLAKELKNNLEKIGFSVELRGEDFDSYFELVKNRDYDIYLGGLSLSNGKPDLAQFFSSENAVTGKNYGDFASENMDNILKNVDMAVSEREYKLQYAFLQDCIVSELPIIGIAFRKQALFMYDDLYGASGSAENGLFYDMNKWFISS